MKYDFELALDNANTSHAQVVDLVGTGKRVLDVGCATGALGRALRSRSNRVWGIEIDPQAARVAEADLEKVVVGDVESLDLLEHFESGSFDVVIFADVLEHLRDPVAVLQKFTKLLAPDGSVVVSLPNVAHASVRLALLEGRFEYRPMGLLDDTHLRFFTRRSMEDLVRSAGLVVADMRRTTAGAFETEIPLSPQNFDRRVVERVRSEPDSDTYQFVFRAVPLADRQSENVMAELVARNEELSVLRAEVTQMHALAERFAPPHTVGLLVDGAAARARPWTSLRTSITSLELRRRIDHLALTHLRGEGDGDPATWRGEPIQGLPSFDQGAADLVADAYDAVVLAGDQVSPETGTFAAELLERGCPAVPFGVGRRNLEASGASFREGAVRGGRGSRYESLPGIISVPDPLVLADRLLGGYALASRVDYLRETKQLAVRGPFLVVAVDTDDPDLLPAVTRTLAELGAQTECQVVAVPGPGGTGSVGAVLEGIPGAVGLEDPHEVDLLALVHEARLIVTNAAPVVAVALAVRKPVLAFGSDDEMTELADWSADPDLAARTPAEMLSRIGLADSRAADGSLVERLQAPVELAYDDVAAVLRGASGRRLALSLTQILELQRSHVGAVEAANAALQARLVWERNLLAVRATEFTRERGDRDPLTPFETVELQHRVATAEARADEEWRMRQADAAQLAEALQIAHHLRGELDAVMSTRTMRMLAPARKVYQRLRGR